MSHKPEVQAEQIYHETKFVFLSSSSSSSSSSSNGDLKVTPLPESDFTLRDGDANLAIGMDVAPPSYPFLLPKPLAPATRKHMLELLRGLNPSLETWGVYVFGFAPILALLYFCWAEQKRRASTESPPQEEKLLRPAGHSCYRRVEEAEQASLTSLLYSAGLSAFCGCFVVITIRMLRIPSVRIWSIIPAITAVAFACLTIDRIKQSLKNLGDLRKHRLGLRGEQAVAEVLHQLGQYGYQAFHDFPAGRDWNIDHIIIGTRGVYVVETKARMRRGSRNGQPEHYVLVKGDTLEFPTFRNSKAIPQARRNAEWLPEYLSKRTGDFVDAKPLLVIPGWFISPAGKTETGVHVSNASYLAMYLQDRPECLGAASVQRIVAVVDEKCRDVEF